MYGSSLTQREVHTQQPAQSFYRLVIEPVHFGCRRRFGFAFGLAGLVLALNLFGSANLSLNERLLASLIIIVCALPSWLWLAGNDLALPFMPFMGMVFTVYYAAPLFLLRDYTTVWSRSPLPHTFVARSLELVLTGLLCIYAGYYGPVAVLLSTLIARRQMAWRRIGNVKFNGLLFGTAGLLLFTGERALSLPLSFVQLLSFASDLCLLGACILFALQLTNGIGFACGFFLWGVLVPVRLWLGLGTGLTSEGLIIALLLIFTYASVRHRLPWLIIIIGGLSFCVIRPAEQSFRGLTWRGGMMENATVADKSVLLAGMIRETLSESIYGLDGTADDMVQFSMRRLGTDTLTLADVLHDTPRIVPYWNGATYYPLLFKPLPRILFPDKPEEVTGQAFGHRYGLLNQSNFETSYNLPQLIEGYVNFGLPGVVLSMLLFGILYRLVQLTFIHENMGFGSLISGIYLSVKLLQIESATSLVLGDVIWTLVFLSIVNLMIKWTEKAGSNSAI
ncbi:MAG TPA: hypothetical protein VMF50_00630 [Candidatus Binataceae bacterium]|nr:hypothetical protein [Candidatus Binataceae bacterium]